MFKNVSLILLMLIITITMLSACGTFVEEISEEIPTANQLEKPTSSPTEEPRNVIGLTLSEDEFPRMDGSTATIPLGRAVAALMMDKSPDECDEYVEFGGTSSSYERLITGGTDILLVYEMPNSVDEFIQEIGTEAELEIAAIGRDALIFMVNAQNLVEKLTHEQIKGIYSGEITNWNEINDSFDDAEISAYQRNKTAGSQVLMEKLVMGGVPMISAPERLFIYGEMGGILSAVADYENGRYSIGYNVYYYAALMKNDPNIKLIAVDDVYPSKESITDETYPFVNDFYTIIRADAPQDSPERLLFRWFQTEEGRALVDHEGYAPLSEKTKSE